MKQVIKTKKGLLEITTNPRKAIKIFCTECVGYNDPVENCTAIHCALYPYRSKILPTKHSEQLIMKDLNNEIK